jgi:hypothetical protein
MNRNAFMRRTTAGQGPDRGDGSKTMCLNVTHERLDGSARSSLAVGPYTIMYCENFEYCKEERRGSENHSCPHEGKLSV